MFLPSSVGVTTVVVDGKNIDTQAQLKGEIIQSFIHLTSGLSGKLV